MTKRSDLDTLTVLRAVDGHGFNAYNRLVEHFPPKVVLAAFEREVAAGRLDYGVSLTVPWLEHLGRQALTDAEPTTEVSA